MAIIQKNDNWYFRKGKLRNYLEKQKEEKAEQKNTPVTWKRNVSPHSQKICLLERVFSYKFDKSASASDINEENINLDVLTEVLAPQSCLYLLKKRGELSHKYRGKENFYWY